MKTQFKDSLVLEVMQVELLLVQTTEEPVNIASLTNNEMN